MRNPKPLKDSNSVQGKNTRKSTSSEINRLNKSPFQNAAGDDSPHELLLLSSLLVYLQGIFEACQFLLQHQHRGKPSRRSHPLSEHTPHTLYSGLCWKRNPRFTSKLKLLKIKRCQWRQGTKLKPTCSKHLMLSAAVNNRTSLPQANCMQTKSGQRKREASMLPLDIKLLRKEQGLLICFHITVLLK